MDDTKECPSCGIVNPVSRVTCHECHTKLTGKNPFEGKEPEPIPVEERAKGTRRQRKIRKPRTPKEPVQETKEETPPEPHIRKKRQTKPKSLSMQYFALDGNTLVPISISIQIKPMRKKGIENVGQKLISLWNRNKLFIS